jgi:hypothetical protein
MNTANNNDVNRQEVNQPNDRTTFMTDEEKIINKLEADGFTDQFRVEKKLLRSMTDPKKSYKPKEIKAVNFYRYEGISDPDDMSIIYAIETNDGRKGTLVDAYGRYSDEETGTFMQDVEIQKKVSSKWKA